MEDRKKSKTRYTETHLSLSEFNKLNLNEQNEKITDILADAYGGRKKVKSETLLKVINFSKEKTNKTLKLENSVTVENTGVELIFTFSHIRVIPILIFYIGLLIFLASAATFSYLGEMKRSMLNIDIDGDGIPEINIDINNDEIAEINIDLDGDKKPDQNIDYMGNNVAIFNVYKDGQLFNKMNQDTNNDGVCDLNCDVDEDGWPDTNIDLDGDGKPDLALDPDGTGKPTMNIDVNGDGVCDIQCDNDGDGKCDEYCLSSDTIQYIDFGDIKDNNNLIGTRVPALNVTGEDIVCNDLYPTDQPQQDAIKECKATLVVDNISNLTVDYKLNMLIHENTYTSNNFKVRLTSNNNGGNTGYITVPKNDGTIIDNIKIAPMTKQTYNISFILEGAGAEQNYDADRIFHGEFKVELKY